MRLYLPIVGQSVEDTLDDTLAYIIANGYAEYAAAFLEDYAQTLRRLQRIAGALPLHRIPMLAERGYCEIRFSNHDCICYMFWKAIRLRSGFSRMTSRTSKPWREGIAKDLCRNYSYIMLV